MVARQQDCPLIDHFLDIGYLTTVWAVERSVAHDVQCGPHVRHYLYIALRWQRNEHDDHQEATEEEYCTVMDGMLVFRSVLVKHLLRRLTLAFSQL